MSDFDFGGELLIRVGKQRLILNTGARCSVPGCKQPPGEEPVRTKASRTDALEHLPLRKTPGEGEERVPAGVALTHLCPTHRAEFEKLGWLAPAEEEDET